MAFAIGFVGLVPVVGARQGAEGVAVAGASTVRSPLDDVVRVRSRTCGGGELTGTGTMLDDGSVLTAAHVVAGARQIVVEQFGTTAVSALRTSTVDDVAVLILDGPVIPVVGRPLASTDPPIGPALLSLAGHPDGGEQRTRIARAEQYLPGRDANDPPTLLRLDAESHPGDSGGPVLDGAGSVVGMVLSRETVTGLALVAPVSILRAGIASAAARTVPAC